MRIRFLDELSPGAQQKYVDQQEKRREEKKTKLEEISDNGGSNIDTKFEQPLASLLASQTAENTEYNRQEKCVVKGFKGISLLTSRLYSLV